MTPLADLVQQGGAHAWLFVPSAILLGALHGLEPGHSKTMMAAFIVAVRGTVMQAILLGLAATVSHTAIVWIIALGGQYFGQEWLGETSEAWLQIASAVLIIAIALWMIVRIWREQHPHHHHHHHDDAEHRHHNDHADEEGDAHSRAHAADIERRFAGRSVTTGQIVLFGLTGGLIPCPAAITVLLICLQLKQLSLGFALVLCFGIGLAVTMVSAGVLAALSVRHIAGRWSGFGTLARRAPYASAALVVVIGLYTGWLGLHGLRHGHDGSAGHATLVRAMA